MSTKVCNFSLSSTFILAFLLSLIVVYLKHHTRSIIGSISNNKNARTPSSPTKRNDIPQEPVTSSNQPVENNNHLMKI